MRSATISGSGIFKDSSTDERARQVFFDGETPAWQVIIPDFGVVEGAFQLTAIEYAGDYNGEATYELSMASAGLARVHGALMANPWAGEVELDPGRQAHTLKLTLGALAELEAAMQADSLVELVRRFEERRFSTRDVVALIVAGLRGGGWRGTAETSSRSRSRAGRWPRRRQPGSSSCGRSRCRNERGSTGRR